jgi:hypothetical protein
MRRVGYDADTQTYTYRDHHGSSWEGAPGAKYGVLNRSKQNSRTDTFSQRLITSNLAGRVQFKTVDKEDNREEKLISAEGPHKQLLGVLSSRFGRLLNGARDLISRATTKESPNTDDEKLPPLPGKRRSKKQPQRHPRRHTQRRRRRPEKWHEK